MSEVIIVTGAYGVGKSEFASQLALLKAPCYLVDFDVINPYFRPREQTDWFAKQGVSVVGSLLKHHINQEFPAISGELRGLVSAQHRVIVDVAGSENGLKPLASFMDVLQDAQVWLVVNFFRPESTEELIAPMIELFEQRSHLNISGLVCNTHLLDETTLEDVALAQRTCEQLSIKLSIPIKYTMMHTSFATQLQDHIQNPILVFDRLILREEWMKGEYR